MQHQCSVVFETTYSMVQRTCDASSERTARNVCAAGELDSNQVVAGYRRRVRELVAVRDLAGLQLRLRRSVHRHRQRSGTRLRRVHYELGRLVCRRTDSQPERTIYLIMLVSY